MTSHRSTRRIVKGIKGLESLNGTRIRIKSCMSCRWRRNVLLHELRYTLTVFFIIEPDAVDGHCQKTTTEKTYILVLFLIKDSLKTNIVHNSIRKRTTKTDSIHTLTVPSYTYTLHSSQNSFPRVQTPKCPSRTRANCCARTPKHLYRPRWSLQMLVATVTGHFKEQPY